MDKKLKTATLGGGCFWCLEAIYQRVKGVEKVESGYAGGKEENPTYNKVSSKSTGHAEVIQITYNPDIITYVELLEIFWSIHDPTTQNRQGNDVGPQYRSIILYHDEEQKKVAEASKAKLENEKKYLDPVVTEIVALKKFYKAEDYHQDYYNQNRNQPYCRAVIDPKVRKFIDFHKNIAANFD